MTLSAYNDAPTGNFMLEVTRSPAALAGTEMYAIEHSQDEGSTWTAITAVSGSGVSMNVPGTLKYTMNGYLYGTFRVTVDGVVATCVLALPAAALTYDGNTFTLSTDAPLNLNGAQITTNINGGGGHLLQWDLAGNQAYVSRHSYPLVFALGSLVSVEVNLPDAGGVLSASVQMPVPVYTVTVSNVVGESPEFTATITRTVPWDGTESIQLITDITQPTSTTSCSVVWHGSYYTLTVGQNLTGSLAIIVNEVVVPFNSEPIYATLAVVDGNFVYTHPGPISGGVEIRLDQEILNFTSEVVISGNTATIPIDAGNLLNHQNYTYLFVSHGSYEAQLTLADVL